MSAWCWPGCANPPGPWGPGRPVEARDAFEAVRVIGRAAGVELTLRPAQHLPWHPGRCAEVLVGDDGRRARRAAASRGGGAVRTAQGHLRGRTDLDAIPITEVLPAPAVSPFPAVFQDVSLIVGEDVAAQSVVDAVRDGAGALLEDVRLFDVYTGPQIGEGRKSLTLRCGSAPPTARSPRTKPAPPATPRSRPLAARVGAEQRR